MKSALLFLVFAASAAAAGAQPGRAGGPCVAASGASAPAAGCVAPGGRPGPGPRWGRDDTPGWPMMSREERQTHRERMSSFKTYEECRAYMDEHHQQMTARAKERGRDMPGHPRRDACLPLKPKQGAAR